jgi:outer membrane protein
MKNTFKIILLCACCLFAGGAFSQTLKIGHINTTNLLQLMPQLDTANRKLENTSKMYQDELKRMSDDLKKRADEYERDKATLPLALREIREKDLYELQVKIQNFQETASQKIDDEQKILLEPIYKIAKDAIAKVAKEKGYSYVFDTSTGAVLHFPETEDILPLVKKELNIK